MMRADAGLHADPTRRQIGEPGLHLATRPLLPQHDGTARAASSLPDQFTYRDSYEALKQAMLEAYETNMDSEISVTIDASFFDTMGVAAVPSVHSRGWAPG